jgi:hypothetical protein
MLSMYHKNLTSALKHLKNMKEITTAPFFRSSRSAEEAERGDQDLTDLSKLYVAIESKLLKITSALAATSSSIPSGLPLTVLLAQILTTESRTYMCPICEPQYQGKILDAISQENEFYGELLVRQYRLVKHFEVEDAHDLDEDLFHREVHRYLALSARFSARAHLRFKFLGMLEAAAISLKLSIYHPDTIGEYTFKIGEDPDDCLSRTSIHSWLDHTAPNRLPKDLEQLEPESRDWVFVNDQDILSRTPLHIACQHGWVEGVKALLALGANTATKTIYGSTPLHYAAVRGSMEICHFLLQQGSDQLVVVDCEGYTARHYALKNGHIGVANLLQSYDQEPTGAATQY